MIIVLTQDKAIKKWCQSLDSNSENWEDLWFIESGSAPTATVLLNRYLKKVTHDEPLCITGHGNDNEIGDQNVSGPESWSWSPEELAVYLNQCLPSNYNAPILLEVCSDSVTNFASKLAMNLAKYERTGLWVYGYIKAVSIKHPFPNPLKLDDNVELHCYSTDLDFENADARRSDTLPEAHGGSKTPKTWPSRNLTKPNPNSTEYNIPSKKWYVVNETGNIMVSTTEPDTSKIDPEVLSMFEEVAVFFAALTKAITSTPRPEAKKPYSLQDYYTIYDYAALEAVVNRSGMFVNVHREDVNFNRKSISATFNIEFIEAVLGVALTDGIGAEALMASLNAMGKQATISYNHASKSQEIGNLLFVCEYLFGMPIINVLYFYLDDTQTTTVVELSPCVKISDTSISLDIHKDTFLFVLPDWIKKYAGDLASVADDPQYQQLVKQLQAYITDNPVVLNITDGTNPVSKLTVGTTYTINGINMGTKGKVYIGGTEQTVGASGWGSDGTTVAFKAIKPTQGTGIGPVVIEVTSGNEPKITQSMQSYEVS